MITKNPIKNETEVPVHNQTVISKMRKATYLVQPVGFERNPADDFWIHMEFSFNGRKSEVEVEGFWVTDAMGAELQLSDLNFHQVQFIVQAMNEEFDYQVKCFYDELEADYYEMKKEKSEDFFDFEGGSNE